MTTTSNTRLRIMTLIAALAMGAAPRARAEGTAAADAFLLLPVSAREVGLGQATLPVVRDATAFHWNPAGIGMVSSPDFAASYARMYEGVANHQMVAVAAPTGYRGLSVGLAWVRLGVDDIPRYPVLGPLSGDRFLTALAGATGYFGYAQSALFLTIARRNEFDLELGWQYLTLPMSVPVGVTIKYLSASTGDSSFAAEGSGIGIDVGAQSHFSLARALDTDYLGTMSFGLTLANVGGTRMTWNTPTDRTDKQDLAVRWGAAYDQPIPIARGNLSGSLVRWPTAWHWGVDYTFMDRVSVRVGRDMIEENGLSFGAGVSWRALTLDYGLQRHDLGASHRVSLHYDM